jgi:hypothetical protein
VSSSTSSIVESSSPDKVLPVSQRTNASNSVADARRLSSSASNTSDNGHKAGLVGMTSAKNQRMNDRVDRYINEYPPYLSEATRLTSDTGRPRRKSKEEDAILQDIPEVPTSSKEAGRKRVSIVEPFQNTKTDKEGSWRRRSKTFSNMVRRKSTAT